MVDSFPWRDSNNHQSTPSQTSSKHLKDGHAITDDQGSISSSANSFKERGRRKVITHYILSAFQQSLGLRNSPLRYSLTTVGRLFTKVCISQCWKLNKLLILYKEPCSDCFFTTLIKSSKIHQTMATEGCKVSNVNVHYFRRKALKVGLSFLSSLWNTLRLVL